jgi:septum site-determining protein MinC
VDRPLRSGQRVYAGTDIVVLDMVSYGAEVIADGNVHVYAPLRGRAVAGPAATPAPAFSAPAWSRNCSIAGIYRTIETDLPGRRRQAARCAWREKNRYRTGMRDTGHPINLPICLKGIVQTWPKSSS